MNGLQQRDRWNRDDIQLEEEFEDVVSTWRKSADKLPRVPAALDRRIREQARYKAGDELKQSWLLGTGPQLVLAICILFGIGLFFVTSLDNRRDEGRLSDPTTQDVPATPLSWIRLEFTVNEAGEVADVEVVERCIRTEESGECLPNEDSLDRRAIETVLSRQYSMQGIRQDVVTFPPTGK